MFYFKKWSSNLVTIFYYVIGNVYIYSWKKVGKNLTHFGDANLEKVYFFVSHVSHTGVLLDNGVHPPWFIHQKVLTSQYTFEYCKVNVKLATFYHTSVCFSNHAIKALVKTITFYDEDEFQSLYFYISYNRTNSTICISNRMDVNLWWYLTTLFYLRLSPKIKRNNSKETIMVLYQKKKTLSETSIQHVFKG